MAIVAGWGGAGSHDRPEADTTTGDATADIRSLDGSP
jgi:hypothetical protein